LSENQENNGSRQIDREKYENQYKIVSHAGKHGSRLYMDNIWKTKVEIRIHEPIRGFQAQKKYFLGRIRK
jgi:hypothetical protein